MAGFRLGNITEPQVNPFRSPVRKFCSEQRMPWYSNAFIYRLVYGEQAAAAAAADMIPDHTSAAGEPAMPEGCALQ